MTAQRLCLAAALTFATALATRAGPGTDLTAKGKALVEANCARCHAIGPEGQSTHPKAPPFRVVVTRYPVENLAEALAEGIVGGHRDMPEFVFQPSEIDAILAYLDSLKAAPETK